MFQIKLGITTFFLTLLPTKYITVFLLGSMYRPKLGFITPAIYAVLEVFIPLLLSYLATLIFMRITDLTNRLPSPKPATKILLISSSIILFMLSIRILGYFVYTGGQTIGFLYLFSPLALIAKIALYIGIAQLLMAMEPNKKYNFTTYTPFSDISKNKI